MRASRLKRWAAVAVAAAGSLFAVGGAAGVVTPPVVASGPSPFTGCTADDPTTQQQFSTLYPNAEPEPRAAINPANPANIVGMYQQTVGTTVAPAGS